MEVSDKTAIVRLVLTSGESDAALGKQLGCSRTTIQKIRTGGRLADILPELPRRGKVVAFGDLPKVSPEREKAVKIVLTEDIDQDALSERTGFTKLEIREIRRGKWLARVHPEIKRHRSYSAGTERKPTPTQLNAVKLALMSNASSRSIADEVGVSRDYILSIRYGKTLKWVLPELPRGNHQVGCRGCKFYTGKDEAPCDMGMPEASVMNGCGSFYPSDAEPLTQE